jgi:hypothetical protein
MTKLAPSGPCPISPAPEVVSDRPRGACLSIHQAVADDPSRPEALVGISCEVPAVGASRLASERNESPTDLAAVWPERGESMRSQSRSARRGPTPPSEGAGMTVMIGVDPHKATHTAVAIGEAEE